MSSGIRPNRIGAIRLIAIYDPIAEAAWRKINANPPANNTLIAELKHATRICLQTVASARVIVYGGSCDTKMPSRGIIAIRITKNLDSENASGQKSLDAINLAGRRLAPKVV